MDSSRRQEQVRALYNGGGEVLVGCLFVAALTSLVMWPVVDRSLLLCWLALYVGHLAARRAHLSHYRRLPEPVRAACWRRHGLHFEAFSALNGALWGLTSLLFFVDDYSYVSLLMVIHGGFLATSLGATAPYELRAFVAFTGTASLFFAAGTLVRGGAAYLEHVLILICYPFVLYPFARRIERIFLEQIELRFANEELMADLREQRDTAERAMYAKNRFLASASHDLRQPVHALGLFVSSLEPHLEADEPRRLLERITQTTASLGGLFHGLLDISKLDADVVTNAPQHVRLEALFVLIHGEYAPLARDKGIAFDVHLPEGRVFHVDPTLLERVVRNVVGNAIDATERGAVELRVEGGAGRGAGAAGDPIDIVVSDTGRGIPAEELGNIFSEYHQLENPERDRQKGLGLGLAIVSRLAKLMGIRIGVESAPGLGSTFTISVPAGDPARLVVAAPPTVGADCAGLSVVVVDDEVDILAGMRSLLTRWDCTALTAESGTEAIALLQGRPAPDVIVADFRLRADESGLDVVQRIRDELNLDVPAILITGDTAPERLRQASTAHVEILHKPVEPKRLRQTIGRLTATPAPDPPCGHVFSAIAPADP